MTIATPITTTAHVETPSIPTYDARELTNGDTQARIVLEGQVYILRITRAGKLLMTK